MPKMNKIILEEKNRIKIRDMLSKHKSPCKKKRGEARATSTLDVQKSVPDKNPFETYQKLQECEIIKK
jgi:hypothetical protein